MASEYLRWKYRDVQPDAPAEQTKKQRRQNWWHYHKWYVVLGAAAVLMAGNLVWHTATQVRPDYQIAYVGGVPLPDAETAVWENRLSVLGTDCNGDGKVIIKINQYVTPQNADDALYTYASNVKLMADLDSCESYFFCWRTRRPFKPGTKSCKRTGSRWKAACSWPGGIFGRAVPPRTWKTASSCGTR